MTAPQHPATTRRGEGVTADGEFYMPTRVFFGRGVAGRPGAHAAGRRAMLVTDPGVQAAGLADPIRDHPPALTAAAGMDALSHAVDSLHRELDS
jgi:alcohol dehydrogenase class IV